MWKKGDIAGSAQDAMVSLLKRIRNHPKNIVEFEIESTNGQKVTV